jgi:hypothetical protein
MKIKNLHLWIKSKITLVFLPVYSKILVRYTKNKHHMTKNNKPTLKKFRGISSRLTAVLAALILVAGLAIPVIVPHQTHAAGLLFSRQLKLSSSAKGDISTDANGTDVCALTTSANPQGGCGAKAKHTVTFTMATSGATVGSIIIMYCTSPVFQTSCTTPTGMTTEKLTNASVSVTGLATGAFSLDTSTANTTVNSALPTGYGTCNDNNLSSPSNPRNNCVIVKRSSAVAETGTPTGVVAYGGETNSYIVNPIPGGNENYSFYARIIVFSDTGYTSVVDYGGTAASTAQQIDITAKVQEILNFSVGVGSPAGSDDTAGGYTAGTVPAVGSSCSPLNDSGALTLGDTITGVLSTGYSYTNHSYFRVNTNTVGGTIVYYSGDTLKSGSNTITAIGATEDFAHWGTKQFGLALDTADTNYSFTDLVGHNGGSPTTNYTQGSGTVGNGTGPHFAFDTASKTAPIPIAASTAGITCDTGAIRYVASISTNTVAGIYRTTITYIATGTY